MCFCAHDTASFKFQASGEATSSPHSGNLFEAHTSKDELRSPWHELIPHSTHIALTETTSSCIYISPLAWDIHVGVYLAPWYLPCV